MANFKKVINDYNGQEEIQFQARLVSVSDQELENVNGTPYRVATIEFENANGVQTQSSAIIYSGNYDRGMTTGRSYLCTAVQGEQGVLVRMSHLEQAARATADDFGNMFSAQKTEAPAAKIQEGQVA